MPVGLVIVSHSRQLAEGVREVAGQMAGNSIVIRTAGGAFDGSLGTNAEAIAEAMREADTGDGVLVLMDLGSSVMSAEAACEMLPPDQQARVRLSNAPLVEGAFVAAVEASIGKSLNEVAEVALNARQMSKVSSG